MPLRRDAANLSRIRSLASSRSNWAKESKKSKTPHRSGRIELPSGCHERDIVCLEQLDQLSKIGQRAGQTIDLVDDYNIDLAGSDVLKQRPEGRAIQRATGKPTVIVVSLDQPPAFVRLALDIGFSMLFGTGCFPHRSFRNCDPDELTLRLGGSALHIAIAVSLSGEERGNAL
jgi:hypothetical protein